MTVSPANNESKEDSLPPQKVYPLRDIVLPQRAEPVYHDYQAGVPIVIDLGRSTTRIGLANKSAPSTVFPTLISRYRERKINKTLTLLGNDVFIDPSMKSSIRTPFDGSVISNWDSIEYLLDYSFVHLGVNSKNGVDNPIVMTELLASPYTQRANMMQLLFEAYSVPKASFGSDSLFSYYYNGGRNGLVIGTGHHATHVIPVVNHKPVMGITKRIDWGGSQAVDYMTSSIGLKYPYFPSKINNFQFADMVHNYCYVSKDYQQEIKTFFDLPNLEKSDIVLEAPFTELVKPVKTEEEIRLEAEKRKETIQKLQESAKKTRLEKLVQKERDFEYYTELKNKLSKMNKKDFINTLRTEGFDDEAELNKHYGNLERSLKRARNQDVGDEVDEGPPSFPLVEIPDSELDEAQIKEKRKQRLIKANYDARQRAKQEKEKARIEAEEEAAKEKKWRETDLQGWIADRRGKLDALMQKRKNRMKLKEELTDRKSRAAQTRMKNIASLADDEGNTGRKKRGKDNVTIDDDPNDTFGANDDDWAIYRDIANVDNEEIEEEEEQEILKLEEELLEFDPEFTIEDTLGKQFDWRRSILHRFLRGPRDYDAEDMRQQHQIHLNIERIKVPEILFQPSIAGIDQAGICEISQDTILRRLPQEPGFSGDDSNEVLKDIFVTGGQALFQNFEERLQSEFVSLLPTGSNVICRRAADPLLDAWKGMAKWSTSAEAKDNFITKRDYEEKGPDYIKENNFGFVEI